MPDNKRIAKNTFFLYFRMLIIMAVTLYTSRVILDKLGTDDYALYNVVGGIVAMLSFLNGTLSNGTARFLTFELGRGNQQRLCVTFSTTFYIHLLLAAIIILIMETGGMWYVYNKLVVAPERFHAALIVFQLSLLTTFVSITQVPYTSIIMAHEDMGIYAYISIFEAFAKLLVVYLLSISSFDKLITYAILIAVVQIIVALSYRVFAIRKYQEAHIGRTFDRGMFKQILGYSGWNTIANLTEMLNLQGVIVLLNLFFQPVVVAAQAIGNQIAGQVMQFSNNFRSAINPQIIKLYASGAYEDSRRLTLRTTVYVFDLMLLIGLPLILLMKPILNLWLVDVPPYTVLFSQLIVVNRILATIGGCFYIPMMAAAKLKTNSVASIFLGIGQFVFLYVIFRLGADVMWVQYLPIFVVIIYVFVLKPYILYKEINYPFKEILQCFFDCFKVAFFSIAISFGLDSILGDSWMELGVLLIGSVLSVAISSYLFLDKPAKQKLQTAISSKILRK